jgi:glycosyltransferase involved in cell wall biosynthesis
MTYSNPLEPTVSVIMAVKNGGQEVRQAVESILNQTLTDFEFIIINDGSTDETLKILAEYQDPRIHVYSQENEGLARSLNRGFSLAVGAYIARQDHDDISLPTRLEKQVAYLKHHPNCGLLGTAAEIWGPDGPQNRRHEHPLDSATLTFDLIFNNPFVHTSWMLPSKVISNIGYYTIDPEREPPEDYEYVSRICRQFSVANLPEPLVIYREFPNSLSSQLRPTAGIQKKSFNSKLAIISTENVAWLNDLSFDDPRAIFLGRLTHTYLQDYPYQVSFRSLQNLVLKAAKNIEHRYDVILPQSLVKKKINTMRYQYVTSPYISIHRKVLAFICIDGFYQFLDLLYQKLYSLKCRIWIVGSKMKDIFRRFGLLPPKQ